MAIQDNTTDPDVFDDEWTPADRGQWRPKPADCTCGRDGQPIRMNQRCPVHALDIPKDSIAGLLPPAIRSAVFLGRAVSIIEGLVESPTDAIDIRMAQEFLVDYRRWLEAAS